jgi:hypothetical protein
MARQRLTWGNPSRKASAPPATPGYEEPSIHPAAYPDPEADAYENGDTSAWAEDPHPGPYPNGAPPALPGTDAPQGHPATDMAHYFPNGVGKQASRQLRAALEAKAAKCIRLATRMLGKNASTDAIELQAIDLMTLTERQIQATLRRFAEEGGEGNTDLLAFENMTLTPPRTGGDDDTEELLQAMLAEESDEGGESDEEAMLASMMAESDEEAMLASMMAGEQKRLASLKSSKKAGQNDPRATYKGKKAEEDEGEKAEEDKPEGDEASKKAAHFQRLAAYWTKLAKKADKDEPEENEEEAEKDEAKESSKKAKKSEEVPEALKENQFKAKDDKAEKKAAFMRLAGEFLSADLKETLAALIAEDAEVPAEKAADDFMMDDMGEDPMLDGLGMDDAGDLDMDDLSMLYGMHTAADEPEAGESEEGEKAEEEEKPAKEEKQAAVRPQPRRASTGVKTLGTVAKVASSSGVDDLSKLWASAPDVSDIFGTKS